jgi:hypothetical protein
MVWRANTMRGRFCNLGQDTTDGTATTPGFVAAKRMGLRVALLAAGALFLGACGSSDPSAQDSVATEGAAVSTWFCGYSVSGQFLDWYSMYGGPGGVLGCPMSYPYGVREEYGGAEGLGQNFKYGMLLASPVAASIAHDVGIHAVYGAIGSAYFSHYGPAGRFGYPLEEEHWVGYTDYSGLFPGDPHSASLAPIYARGQAFENGWIIWDADIQHIALQPSSTHSDGRPMTQSACYKSRADFLNCLKLAEATCR